MGLKVTTNGSLRAIDVIGLTAAKLQCRVDDDFENELIADYCEAAWDYCERQSWRQWLPATIVLTLPRFCFPVYLPRSPVVSIDSVTYYDANNVQQSIAIDDVFAFDITAEPVEITPAQNAIYPTTYQRPDAVTITYQAGKGTRKKDQNPSAMQAVRLLLADYYENREAGMLSASQKTLDAAHALLDADSCRDYRVAPFVS